MLKRYFLRHTFCSLLRSSDVIINTQNISLHYNFSCILTDIRRFLKSFSRLDECQYDTYDNNDVHLWWQLPFIRRRQPQDVNITTRSWARPLPSSTWNTLRSPRVSPEHKLCGRRTQHVSGRAIYEIGVELFIPTPIPAFSSISLSLSFAHTPSASISSHFPNTAAFLLYYFDESLTVPLPHHTPSPSAPRFLLTTFASLPSFHSHPHQHILRHVCAWPGIIIRFVMSSYYSLL
jgi:hypothetical protein